MSMLQSLLGVRLVLKIGKDRPKPVPYDVIMALSSIEVEDNAVERDLFTITLKAGKRQAKDYSLLRTGLFEPRNRVAIALQIGAKVEPLISGVIIHFEHNPSNEIGMTTFTITGEGIDFLFDLVEQNKSYDQQDDTSILQTIVKRYAQHGVNLDISDRANDLNQPDDNRLIPRQYATDLQCIKQLAERNGFVFYSDPLPNGDARVYWGPQVRKGPRQFPLTMNMGASTNVTDLRFTQNSRTPVTAQGSRLQTDSDNKEAESISDPSDSDYKTDTLAANEPFADRVVLMRETAKYETRRAAERAKELMIARFSTVKASGEVDTVRYGHIIRAGGVIGVRGAGALYNGDYYVSKVKHSIQVGKYTQSFDLEREGLGAKSDRVRLGR